MELDCMSLAGQFDESVVQWVRSMSAAFSGGVCEHCSTGGSKHSNSTADQSKMILS